LLCALDGTLTLVGQSAEYWAGHYAQVNEGSPTFNHLLQFHPAAFAAGLLGWAAIFVVVILLLPDAPALILSIAVTFGHTAGAATWLLYRFQHGYQACNALFLTTAIVLGLGIRWGWRAVPANDYKFRGWPAGLRWAVAVGLFGVGVYLFLWPRMP
jgi:hypothetical protein